MVIIYSCPIKIVNVYIQSGVLYSKATRLLLVFLLGMFGLFYLKRLFDNLHKKGIYIGKYIGKRQLKKGLIFVLCFYMDCTALAGDTIKRNLCGFLFFYKMFFTFF